MSVILLCVTLAGAGFGKILLEAGVTVLPLRYAAAVILSYGVFFIMVRLWLWYVSSNQSTGSTSRGRMTGGVSDIGDIPLPDLNMPDSGAVSPGGGQFGGAGASASWTDGGTSGTGIPASASGQASSTSSDLPSLGDLGDVDDPRGLILMLLLIAAVAILGGVWIYVVVQAPVILSEALFQLLLASGMYKKTKQMHEEGWMGSVLRSTWKPLCLVLLLSGGVGFAVQHFCPHALKIAAALQHCE